jgi:hypothetical protein
MMNLVSVESSHVNRVGYDPTELILYVEFKPRHSHQQPALYAYDGVSPTAFDELLAAPSKGYYLNHAIKRVYPHRLVDLEEGDMSDREPWVGDPDPNRTVAVTLPYHVAKRVLDAIVHSGHRIAHRRPDDRAGLEALALASRQYGIVLQAPSHRQFYYKAAAPWAVLAGSLAEYQRWEKDSYQTLNQDARARAYPGGPVFVDSIEDVERYEVFSGSSTTGTAYRREDFQELLAAVKWRTI